MITIRHSRPDEKEKVYQWLYLSDTTPMHTGPPDYPENPAPDLKQFLDDFEDFYFTESGRDRGSVMIIEKGHEEIGCICYALFHLKPGRAELDIWMKEIKFCGKGFGPEAIRKLIEYLYKKNINKFLIRPSEKNIRAIKGYENAGFVRVKDKESTVREFLLEEYYPEYGSGDYGFDNTAVLIAE